MIAINQNICYNNKRKSLSRANVVYVYTKDKMDKLFLFIYKKVSESGTVKQMGNREEQGGEHGKSRWHRTSGLRAVDSVELFLYR